MKRLKIYFILFLFSYVQVHAQTAGTDSLSTVGTSFLPDIILMYQPKTDTVSFWIKNLSETDLLSYQASIEYKRKAKTIIEQDSLQVQIFENQFDLHKQKGYVDSAYLSATYGNPDLSSVTVATKFNADSTGYTISSVGTWFIAEQDTSGIIQVEIRAGGNSIQDAIPVSQCSARYEFDKSVINGHFYNIKLEKPVSLYPNEDFYVVFTYPAGISRPQGCAVNNTLPVAEGIYWVEKDGQFVDLQQQEGYSHSAWLMYVEGAPSENMTWLSFVSNPSGTVSSTDSTLFYLQLNGLVAGLGSQYADVVIQFDDSINSVITIPVHLRLNEAPYFLDPPATLQVYEATVSTVPIKIEDYEQDAFTIVPVIGCKFVQFSLQDSVMTLEISPAKGDMGEYVVMYHAIDEYDAVRELKITISVLENQAPRFIEFPFEIALIEGEDSIYTIKAEDKEKDDFEIRVIDGPDFISSKFENEVLYLHVSPKVGNAGDHIIRLVAEDTVGSIRELTIPVRISYKNRPPVCLKEGEPIILPFMGEAVQFDINDYFTDPDGDSFSFDVENYNSNIVDLHIDDESHFTLKPKLIGGATLDFTLIDIRGEQAKYSLSVIVGPCEDPSRIIVQKWNKVLLVNNVSGEYAETGYQWYKNGTPIKNDTLQYYSSENDTGGLLDVNAEYYVRIVRVATKDTIFTCPCKPVLKTVMANAWPNPVARGGNLYIEHKEPISSGIIQVIDILGNTRKTIPVNKNNITVQMPETPGFYVVRVVFDDNEDVFRIKVK